MFTVLRFTPLDSTYAPFSFVLHPRLSNRNMIDDDLLQLSFFLEAKASVKLVDDVPTIRSLRSGLGIYLNHQILGSTSSLLHDGDIVAFPQRRHNLKTAVRFLVETEVIQLRCGVDQELLALRGHHTFLSTSIADIARFVDASSSALLGEHPSFIKELVRGDSHPHFVIVRSEQHFGTDFGTGIGTGLLLSRFYHNLRHHHLI
ncbi:unnamed protein product [Tilletia controversa]|uniref:Uncharacterized protein n=2 Tax=Tilletia TaxID=13289 RepID=A0A9N8LVV9_9BASI|nr:unnamed protein product [Tilletia caries]CAD6902613.1 unnamed protein product [Tilletia laevis]CAD6913639.1 unnamed protein product [Tilletia controversa]CAD6940185.1 unnamed protein product [Tilletia caries]CAD6942444.1 unnamed protein product [Tilletia laevis]